MDKQEKKRKDHNGKSKQYDKKKIESQKNTQKQVKEQNPSQNLIPKNETQTLANDLQKVLEISQISVDKFKKREIQSNWSKYESPIEEDSSISTNFENLMNAPISTGGHFQFKSEKNMEVDLSNEYREYFSLNINKLAKSLETLPFYVRHELDKSLFTDNEIKTMDSKCSNFEKDANVNKMIKLLKGSDKPAKNLLKNEDSKEDLKQNTEEIQNTVEDDLDELLHLKTSPINEISHTDETSETINEPELNISKLTPITSRSNLENWLDDLLQ